jgi:hypothetical protein
LQTEFFALEGMSHLLNTVELVRKRINHDLEITGIIACMFDARTSLAKAVHEKIKEYFGSKVFKTVIRKNIRLAESPSHGKPIMVYDPEAIGAADYLSLAKEVIAQEKAARLSVGVPEVARQGVGVTSRSASPAANPVPARNSGSASGEAAALSQSQTARESAAPNPGRNDKGRFKKAE